MSSAVTLGEEEISGIIVSLLTSDNIHLRQHSKPALDKMLPKRRRFLTTIANFARQFF
jgi:hypothetical protein